jgi:hypothetical protein
VFECLDQVHVLVYSNKFMTSHNDTVCVIRKQNEADVISVYLLYSVDTDRMVKEIHC